MLEWFNELQNARQSNGFGLSVLTYAEIGAWASLTGRTPTPFEVKLIKDLDVLFVAITMKNATEKGKTA